MASKMRKICILVLTIVLVSAMLFACSTQKTYTLSFTEATVSVNIGDTHDLTLGSNAPATNEISLTSSDGDVVTVNGLTLTAVGGGSATVTATYGDQSARVIVTVNKSTPTVTAPPTYEQSASRAIGSSLPALLGGTGSVEGTFSWVAGQTIEEGTNDYTYVFTPTNTRDYNTVNGTLSITSTARTPSVFVAPVTDSLTYGDDFPVLATQSGSTAGSIAFDAGQTLLAGTHDYSWTFTPANLDRFLSTTGTISLTVAKATPTGIAPTSGVAVLRVGDELPALTLPADSLPGTATLVAGQTLTVGTAEYNYVFVPTDTANYNNYSGHVSLTVEVGLADAAPEPFVDTIYYGDPLPELTLTDTSDEGEISLDADQTILAGTHTYNWTFVSAHPELYGNTTGTIVIRAEKATPSVLVTFDGELSFLDSYPTLVVEGVDGIATLDVGQTLTIGTKLYRWTFIPTDTDNYTNTAGSLELTVGLATYTEVAPHRELTGTYDGRPLSAYSLSTGYRWAEPTVVPTVAVTVYDAIYNADPTQYKDYPISIRLTLSQATPTVSVQPSVEGEYAFGTLLSNVDMTAGSASVEGSFGWEDTTVAVSFGEGSYAWVFTPRDAVNYATIGGNITVVGGKQRPVLTAAPTASDDGLTYGDSLPTLAGGTANVEGTFSWLAAELTVGAKAYTWKFYPTDGEHYNELLTGNITLNVAKAASTAAVQPYSGELHYGDALPTIQLTADSDAGTVSLDAAQLLSVGTRDYAWTFIPENTNYATMRGTISLTVQKGHYAGITHNAATVTYSSGLTLGGVKLVRGYTWVDTDIALSAGSGEYDAIYNRNADNYEDFALKIRVNVEKARYTNISQIPVTTTYAVGAKLSDVALPTGYRWRNPNTSVTVKLTGAVDVVYNADTANYFDCYTTVRLLVNRADYTAAQIPTHAALTAVDYSPTRSLADIALEEGFGWAQPSVTPTVAVTSYAVLYAADADNYNPYELSLNLTVNAIQPTVYELPDFVAAQVENYTTMPVLSGGRANCAGHFEWVTTADAIVEGANDATMKFISSDTNYTYVTLSTQLWEGKLLLSVTSQPTADTTGLTYGDAMPVLSGGVFSYNDTPVEGSCAFVSTTLYAGTHSYAWRFTPTSGDYAAVDGSISFAVAKATQKAVDVPKHNVIEGVYAPDKTLASYALSEHFSWKSFGLVPGAGTTAFAVLYNPDPDNYVSYETLVTLNIQKADTIGITHPDFSGDSVVYSADKTLADYILNEKYVWQDSTVVPTVDMRYYTAIYTENENYNPCYLKVMVELQKASYTDITHPALNGTYSADAPLSSYVLNAGFVWSNPSDIPTVTMTSYAAVYNADSINYNDYPINISLTLQRATPVASKPVTADSAGLRSGDSLPALQGAFAVAGVLGWDVPDTVLYAGDSFHSWSFVPTDTANYVTVTGRLKLSVNKNQPTITVIPSLSCGTDSNGVYTMQYSPDMPALSNGEANIPGSWSFVAGQTLSVGTNDYKWQFVPTAGLQNSYFSVEGYLTIIVTKADTAATVEYNGDALYYGDSLPLLTLTASSVPGTVDFESGSILVTGDDVEYTWVFTPTEDALYSVCRGTISLTVQKVTPRVVTQPYCAAGNYTYGDTLPQLIGAYSVDGTLSFATATTFSAGTLSYAVVFTPQDAVNYNSVQGTVTLTASRGVPTVATFPTLLAATNAGGFYTIQYPESLPTINGGAMEYRGVAVNGSYSWLAQQSINAGDRMFTWRFTPNDTANLTYAEGSVRIVIEKGNYDNTDGRLNLSEMSSIYTPAKTASQHFVLPAYYRFNGTGDTIIYAGTGSLAILYNANPVNYNDLALNLTYNVAKGSIALSVQYDTERYGLVEDYPIPAPMLTAPTAVCSVGGVSIVDAVTFAWATPLLQKGEQTYNYTVTPDDTANINVYSGSMSFDAIAAVYAFEAIKDGANNIVGYRISAKQTATEIVGDIVLPSVHYDDLPVKEIAADGFLAYIGITSVECPTSLVTIGAQAFKGCTLLNSVTGAQLQSISASAFYGCSVLRDIDLSTAITIGNSAFRGCEDLTDANLTSATSIGEECFYGCTSLSSLSFAEGLTAIPNGAFRNAGSFTQVFIPGGVQTIGDYAFSNDIIYKSLTLVAFPKDSDLASFGQHAFEGQSALAYLGYYEGSAPDCTYGRQGLQIQYLSTAFVWGTDCFKGITFEYADIPSYTAIAESQFEGVSFAEIDLPNSVVSIGSRAFADNGALRAFNISTSSALASIGTDVFKSSGSTTIQLYITDTLAASLTDSSSLGFNTYVVHTPAAKGTTLGNAVKRLRYNDYCIGQQTNKFIGYDVDDLGNPTTNELYDYGYHTVAEMIAAGAGTQHREDSWQYFDDATSGADNMHYSCTQASSLGRYECEEFSCNDAVLNTAGHSYTYAPCGCSYYPCRSAVPDHAANMMVIAAADPPTGNSISMVDGVAQWTCGCKATCRGWYTKDADDNYEFHDGVPTTEERNTIFVEYVPCTSSVTIDHKLNTEPCDNCGKYHCDYYYYYGSCGCRLYKCEADTHTTGTCSDCGKTVCNDTHFVHCENAACPEDHLCVDTYKSTHYEEYCDGCHEKCCPLLVDTEGYASHYVANSCGCSYGYSCQGTVPEDCTKKVFEGCGHEDYECRTSHGTSKSILPCGHYTYSCYGAYSEDFPEHAQQGATLACGCATYACGGPNSHTEAHPLITEYCTDECAGHYECDIAGYKTFECGCKAVIIGRVFDGATMSYTDTLCPYSKHTAASERVDCPSCGESVYSCTIYTYECGCSVCSECAGTHSQRGADPLDPYPNCPEDAYWVAKEEDAPGA